MGNVILLTGSTGFVGKVVVETLFRCRASFPFDKLVVLVRANKTKSARDRFLDLAAASPCFSLLPPSWLDDVRVVEGDMGEDDCGIADTEDARRGRRAAARERRQLPEPARPGAPLPAAAARRAHVDGVRDALDHGAHPRAAGAAAPAGRGAVRAAAFGRAVGRRRLKLTGHPNLYTLTKCLAEHVVAEARRGLPLTIVRPSIVSAAWQYPMPGWIDSFAAVTGVFTGVWMGVLRVVRGNLQTVLDIVPVDSVAMSLVSTCLADVPKKIEGCSFPSYPLRIFHATTGMKHNIHAVQVYRIMNSKRLPAHPTMKPNLRYYGQNALWLPVADFVHQAVPVALGRAWAAVSGNAKLARNLAKARRMQRSCNALFAHFGSHAYDFRSSRATLDPAFEADEYLERVFRGAGRFLLKLDVSLQTVAMEKLYSASENSENSENENESTAGLGSNSSSSSGDEDSNAGGDSVSGGTPASSIMNVGVAITDDVTKVKIEEVLVVEGNDRLPEKSEAVIVGIAVAM
ncbi:male sterility protein-domain-containing protein [Apiospora phragmitis]|uniref:Fatty acyl-CoA reductase n=1 Tax=Apiospora phragmitis TaxID=2905665 RepID=A0ABR1X560_9PEZI